MNIRMTGYSYKLKELKKLSLRSALLEVKAKCIVGCLRTINWL